MSAFPSYDEMSEEDKKSKGINQLEQLLLISMPASGIAATHCTTLAVQ